MTVIKDNRKCTVCEVKGLILYRRSGSPLFTERKGGYPKVRGPLISMLGGENIRELPSMQIESSMWMALWWEGNHKGR